jgi:CheY-like chemotaxis protein
MTGNAAPGALILVVEDNPANQELIQFTLEAHGYQVEVAASTHEARQSIERRRPRLILMDIQLPGQDGLSFTRELKADPGLQSIPIVAVTAHAMEGDRELSLAAGCSGYISKPINTRTIGDELERFLGSSQ